MKKRKLYSLAAAAAATIFIALAFGGFFSPPQSLAEDRNVIETTMGSSSFLGTGGRSAVTADISPKELSIKRGESASFTITLTHEAENSEFKSLTVVAAGVHGMLGLPSTADTMDLEDRAELLEEGKPVPGLIELKDFVTYSPGQVTLGIGESKTITGTVSVPKTLPDEMVTKSIHINPDLEIAEAADLPLEQKHNLAVFSDILAVVVEE